MRSSKGRLLLGVLVSLWLPVASLAADGKARPARLTAKEIVQKHLAVRGGPQAWHGVQSMVWNGKMDVGYADSAARSAQYVSRAMARKGKTARALPPPAAGKEDARRQVQVPFVLEVKRPAKSRIEIEFAGKTAVQLYDGKNGWLLRPFLNRDTWEPFTAEQARSQQGRWDLDGPLLDHAAKGTKVELVKVEAVEGHDAYKLKLTHKDGKVQHVWIDAKSFLDVKIEGTPRRMDGKMRTVWVIQRDFRPVQGLMVPFVLETVVDGYADTHKMVIDKVALNPQLDDARFVKPRA
jgi:outer membrane lipoprotein-sorting protein